MKTQLHHFAYNIQPETLELILELFEKLKCSLAYRKCKERWCMIEQKPIPIDIQIIETKEKPIKIKNKINTHIAFLSNSPKKDIEQIKKWASKNKIKFRQGKWSEKELWFDLPKIFTNFVIEIMHTSIIE